MDIQIQIKDFETGYVKNASGIFSGDNYHIGWSSMSKTFYIDRIGGNFNKIEKSVNKVDDQDIIDILRMS